MLSDLSLSLDGAEVINGATGGGVGTEIPSIPIGTCPATARPYTTTIDMAMVLGEAGVPDVDPGVECSAYCSTALVTFDDAYLAGTEPGCGYVGFTATTALGAPVTGEPQFTATATTAPSISVPQTYSGYVDSGGYGYVYYCPPDGILLEPLEVTFTATVGAATGVAVRSWGPKGTFSSGGSCEFAFHHYQAPVGLTWSQQVSDRVNCVKSPAWSIQSMYVSASLESSGVQVPGGFDDEPCSSGSSPWADCVFVSATAPEFLPFCCVPSGVEMSNHGTWEIVLWGARWTKLPWFCSGEGTQTANCDRHGRYTSGNAVDAAGGGADVAIALFEINQ